MFQRRRFIQTKSLKERLVSEVKCLREEAKALPSGAEREMKLRKTRQAETAAHIDEWLSSPGLQSPK